MISRSLTSRLLKPALSATSPLYSHSAPWITNAMTTPDFQPSRTGTLLHGSTRFCTDSSSKLFHEKSRYFQSPHSKNYGSHLRKLKILDARFVLSSSAHNLTFGSHRLETSIFFSTNEEPENPNQIPDSGKLFLLAEETREVLGGMENHMNQLSNLLLAQGLTQLITWNHLFSSPLVEIRVQCLLVSAIPVCAALAFRLFSSETTEAERKGLLAGKDLLIALRTNMLMQAMIIAMFAIIGLEFRIIYIMFPFRNLEYCILALSACPICLLLLSLYVLNDPFKNLTPDMLDGASRLQKLTWELHRAKKLDIFFVQSRLGVFFIACTQLIIWRATLFTSGSV